MEFRAPDEATQEAYERAAAQVLTELELVAPVASVTNAFTRDPAAIGGYWKARKAFVAAVGGTRPSGTTLITEDFAVPPDRLADACTDLLELQVRHGFDAAVAGHAAHGNLHFLLAFDAAKPHGCGALCRVHGRVLPASTVRRFDGSLKAEHATGRNIAPFLELEWGPRATELMWRIKRLVDPHGILAPRILLDRDPQAHLRGLKTIPETEAVADPCIECGFCEPACPSGDLTTTPRQRIVLRREMLRQPPGSPVTTELLDSYGYDAVDTCARRLALPTVVPGGDRHRRADEGLPAPAPLTARGVGRRADRPAVQGRREGGAAGGGRRRPDRRPADGIADPRRP